MSTQPPGGPGGPPQIPSMKISAPPPKPLSGGGSDPIMNSPFAQMFAKTGHMPTAEELHAIINGILNQQIAQMRKNDAKMKEASRKLKKVIEGDD